MKIVVPKSIKDLAESSGSGNDSSPPAMMDETISTALVNTFGEEYGAKLCKKCGSGDLDFEENGHLVRVVCNKCGNPGPYGEMFEEGTGDGDEFYQSEESVAVERWNRENEK